MAHDVFISYSTDDKDFAFAACRAIEEAGYRCWIAPRDVQPGDDYGEAIVRGVEAARVVVLLLSETSNSSPMVQRELEIATSADKEILPCRVKEVEPSPGLRFYLAGKHWLDAFAGPREEHLRELVSAVRGQISVIARQDAERQAARLQREVERLSRPGEREKDEAERRLREEELRAGVRSAAEFKVEAERAMAAAAERTTRHEAHSALSGGGAAVVASSRPKTKWIAAVIGLLVVGAAAAFGARSWFGSKDDGVLVEVIAPETMDLCGSDVIQVRVTNRTGRVVKEVEIGWPSLSGAMSLGTDDAALLKNDVVRELAPGEARSLRRWLVARDPGRYAFGSGRWTVTGMDGEPMKSAEIKVTPSEIRVGQPKAWIGWDERPNSVEVGEECRLVVRFENLADIPAVDGRLRLQFPGTADVAIGPTEPMAEVSEGNVVTWTLGRVVKGGPQLFTVKFKALQPGSVTIRGTGRVTCATEVANLEGVVEAQGGQEPVALLPDERPWDSDDKDEQATADDGVSGTWEGTGTQTEKISARFTLNITLGSDGELSGTLVFPKETYPVGGGYDKCMRQFTLAISGLVPKMSGTVRGDEISGTWWDADGQFGSWTARRNGKK